MVESIEDTTARVTEHTLYNIWEQTEKKQGMTFKEYQDKFDVPHV